MRMVWGFMDIWSCVVCVVMMWYWVLLIGMIYVGFKYYKNMDLFLRKNLIKISGFEEFRVYLVGV